MLFGEVPSKTVSHYSLMEVRASHEFIRFSATCGQTQQLNWSRPLTDMRSINNHAVLGFVVNGRH